MSTGAGGPSDFELPEQALPASGLDVWWVPLPEIAVEKLLADYSANLSAEEHQRMQLRRLPKGQFQYVFTRVVLRQLLSAYHPSIAPGQWLINKSASGRPYLSQDQTPLSFNLTHCDDCLIFAFSQFADPGVDVELLSRKTDFDGVAKRYFSYQEYSELNSLVATDRTELFYRLWTLKEAAVKASGAGLANGLRQFAFSQPGTESFVHESRSGHFRFWSTSYERHVVSVALMLRQRNQALEIKPVSRRLRWPDIICDISPDWTESQSRNSSTNLEP